jgi:hypothetical protein
MRIILYKTIILSPQTCTTSWDLQVLWYQVYFQIINSYTEESEAQNIK